MINFLPFIEKNPYEYLTNLLKNNYSVKTQLENILNNKLVAVILNKTNIDENRSFNDLKEDEKVRLINNLISFKVKVIGTNSFEQAQVCSGGIPLTEIDPTTMESKLVKGLYIVGELLDVDGDCGGYNLGFAWMSGIKAGIGCSKND